MLSLLFVTLLLLWILSLLGSSKCCVTKRYFRITHDSVVGQSVVAALAMQEESNGLAVATFEKGRVDRQTRLRLRKAE